MWSTFMRPHDAEKGIPSLPLVKIKLIVYYCHVVTVFVPPLFARRYATLEQNLKKHKDDLTDQENLDAFNSFTPGYPYRPDVDMAAHIPDSCPNKAKVGTFSNKSPERLIRAFSRLHSCTA